MIDCVKSGTYQPDSECQQVVFFTDALFVLQALTADKETELQQALQEVCRNRNVTLQWVPDHCGIPGNER